MEIYVKTTDKRRVTALIRCFLIKNTVAYRPYRTPAFTSVCRHFSTFSGAYYSILHFSCRVR